MIQSGSGHGSASHKGKNLFQKVFLQYTYGAPDPGNGFYRITVDLPKFVINYGKTRLRKNTLFLAFGPHGAIKHFYPLSISGPLVYFIKTPLDLVIPLINYLGRMVKDLLGGIPQKSLA